MFHAHRFFENNGYVFGPLLIAAIIGYFFPKIGRWLIVLLVAWSFAYNIYAKSSGQLIMLLILASPVTLVFFGVLAAIPKTRKFGKDGLVNTAICFFLAMILQPIAFSLHMHQLGY